MAKIGLKNIYYALLTETYSGGVSTTAYASGAKIGKAVSSNAAITVSEASLYADDGIAEYDSAFQGGTLTIGVDDETDATFAALLGHTVNADEVTYDVNDVAPYVGVAQIVTKMVEGALVYTVKGFYKVKFQEPSDENTTRGESLSFGTPEIVGKIVTLQDGRWKFQKSFSTEAAALTYLKTQLNITP